ncbi:hypothetical protein KIN20_003566 [Parelaphostrongylus tenuis]|uniref:TAR DNA-binding protein 43 N-terminal domain-containing protein n=1 Tax=Parelaphostrongylus tenuis TaxID=148309 RepID=A0AAD5QEH9_PARTN|nr:hypothetical protein KIN20_003566 [Parelaphostrongylus tenuis]
MSNQIGTVRSLRVFVEAVDVELEDDDGLLWTTLQAAFPGCSGMYYRSSEADCRSAVKFDGKRFLPPGGAWNDRRYYVTLGQRCHAFSQPFGSYENASKQFERSVTAVQKMLGSSLFELPRITSTRKRDAQASPDKSAQCKAKTEAVDSLKSIQNGEQQSPISDQKLSPIEQQFADLAKISTGKDVIIEQQRGEIRKTNDSLQKAEKEIKKYQDQCGELEARLHAMDEELNLLRTMSNEQNYLGDKVAELTSNLRDKDAELTRIREESEVQNCRLREELREAREKSLSMAHKYDKVTENCAEISEQLQMAIISRDLLTNELASLRPLANAIDINNADGVMAYLNAKDSARRHQAEAARAKAVAHEVQCRFDELNDLQTTVIQENTRLLQRNAELEQHSSNFESELQKLDEKWKMRLQKEKHEWEEARKELEAECGSMKKQLVDLQDVLAAVTRDATESSRRAAELQKSREELKQHLEDLAYKAQLRAENHTAALHL